MLPAIRRLEDHIRAEEHLVGVRGRNGDRRRPVEAVLEVGGLRVVHGPKVRPNEPRDTGPEVEAADEAVLRVHVDDRRVARRRDRVLSVASRDGEPLRAALSAGPDVARRAAPGVVVLEAAAQLVGVVRVGRHHVELTDRQVVEEAPRLATGGGHVRAAVVPLDHAVGVLRIDPQGVVVHVNPTIDVTRRLAAVIGLAQLVGREEHLAVVHGRDRDQREVERPDVESVVVADLGPVIPHVARLPEHALPRLDQRIHVRGVARADAEGDPAVGAVGQALLELRPGHAAVGRAVDATPRPAADELPGVPLHLPHRREQHLGIPRLHDEIGAPGGVVHEQHLLPGLAAVAGAIHAAVGTRSPGVAYRRDEHDVGVRGVDDDARDLPHVGEPREFPALPRIR